LLGERERGREKEKVGVQPGRTKKRKGERKLRSYDRVINTIDKGVVSIIIIHKWTNFNREPLNEL
jgi:hypothetical protein